MGCVYVVDAPMRRNRLLGDVGVQHGTRGASPQNKKKVLFELRAGSLPAVGLS